MTREKPWVHPPRAEAGLHTTGVQGTTRAPRRERQSQEKNGSSQSHKYSIQPVFVLGQAQLRQRLRQALPMGTEGNPPERRRPGARGPHTALVFALQENLPRKFAKGAQSPP